MRQNFGNILFPLILLLLTSCGIATTNRETRLIQRDKAEDWYFVRSDVQISCNPFVRLTCSCSDNTIASFGPVFIWSLPVIPNPIWPLQNGGLKKEQASLQLTVIAPPKTSKWDNVNIEMLLNDKTVPVQTFENHSDTSKDERQYNYELGITCGELEESKLDVNIIGFPEKIEKKLLYTHKWHIHDYIWIYGGVWNHSQKAQCTNDVEPSSYAAEQLGGKQFYTAVNIWHERNEIESTNYHKGGIIPFGTKVKIKAIDDGANDDLLQGMPEQSIQFTTDRDKSYKIMFMRSQSKSGTTIGDLFKQYFSETDPKGEGGAFRALTTAEQSNVMAGEIEIGMSKAAVIMAYGYPPKTPSLESNFWVYREERKTRTVEFTDGRVTNDTGREFILTGKEFGPAMFSPDGNEIIFSLGPKQTVFSPPADQSSRIYRARIDGPGLIALTKGEGFDAAPVYSPDGGKILFASRSGNQSHICIMKSDGSERNCLTDSPGCDYSAIFSPDGKKIYFLRAAWYGNSSPIAQPDWHDVDIYSINTDGSDLKKITSNRYYGIGNLSIHPDGNTLMARIIANSEFSVWMIPVGSPSNTTPVQPDLTAYRTSFFQSASIDYRGLSDPLYSPDGTSLLFTWAGNIYVMDLKTNKAQRVTNTERVIYYHPRFSMDGKRIIFSATISIDPGFFSPWREESALWIINKDGTGLEYINIDNTHADQVRKLEPPARYNSPPMR